MVPSRLLFGMRLASNGSVMLKAITYTKPDHTLYVINILVMLGIKGQQTNHLHSVLKSGLTLLPFWGE